MNNKLKQALGPTPECPAIKALGQFADEALEQPARFAMESHISACAHCQSELALLREFVEPTPAPSEKPAVDWIAARLKQRASEMFEDTPAAKLPWWKTVFQGFSLSRAAFVLGALFLVAGTTLYLRHNSAPAVNPGIDTGPETLRSNSVVLIAPIGDQQRPPADLRWQPAPGAARYEVHVMEVDRTDLWSAQTRDTRVELSDAVKAKMAPAKSLLWTVTAFDASSKRIATSSEEKFRLAPAAPK